MERSLLLMLLAMLLNGGCSNSPNSPSAQEYQALLSRIDSLQKELEKSKAEIEELKNTPEVLMATAQGLLAKENLQAAKDAFQKIVSRFPGTDEDVISKKQIASIDDRLEAIRREELRKKTLGFKALKETSVVKFGDLTLKFGSVSSRQRWTFDDYGDRYHYRDAERGNTFITASVSISSKGKNPNLPPIAIYRVSDGQVVHIKTMQYEFVRWRDYGAYLGNYGDDGNDFAHTETIQFRCGSELKNATLDRYALLVVVKKENCFTRNYERFDKPPVTYGESNCSLKSRLTVDDFDKQYALVKVFGKSKL